MSMRTRGALVGLTATLLLAFAVSAASARSFSLSNRNFRIVWARLSFFDENGVRETLCPVTMEGSFHESTIRKVIGTLIGFITRVAVNEALCTGPTRFLTAETLPWHVTYQGFSGLLPRIASLRVLVRSIAYENTINGVACLFKENGVNSISGEFSIEGGGAIISFEFDERTRIARFGGELCFVTEAGLKNAGEVTLLGATTRIIIRLI
ncbi:MAG TPA: hypothetical protein VFU94_12580 [Conexibacter sp.]|nr:hypothetical protein [Conexibacter sp.]